jgi:hypothetical protein
VTPDSQSGYLLVSRQSVEPRGFAVSASRDAGSPGRHAAGGRAAAGRPAGRARATGTAAGSPAASSPAAGGWSLSKEKLDELLRRVRVAERVLAAAAAGGRADGSIARAAAGGQ